jgi:hypothetical protein
MSGSNNHFFPDPIGKVYQKSSQYFQSTFDTATVRLLLYFLQKYGDFLSSYFPLLRFKYPERGKPQVETLDQFYLQHIKQVTRTWRCNVPHLQVLWLRHLIH